MSEPVTPLPAAPERELRGPTIAVPELPTGQRVHPRLNETAEAVATAVGTAVGRVRELPRRMQDLKQRFTLVRGRAREDAAAAAAEWRQTAEQKMAQTRTRARQLAREHPIEVVLGCAIAAFVLGFALRIWRSHNAE